MRVKLLVLCCCLLAVTRPANAGVEKFYGKWVNVANPQEWLLIGRDGEAVVVQIYNGRTCTVKVPATYTQGVLTAHGQANASMFIDGKTGRLVMQGTVQYRRMTHADESRLGVAGGQVRPKPLTEIDKELQDGANQLLKSLRNAEETFHTRSTPKRYGNLDELLLDGSSPIGEGMSEPCTGYTFRSLVAADSYSIYAFPPRPELWAFRLVEYGVIQLLTPANAVAEYEAAPRSRKAPPVQLPLAHRTQRAQALLGVAVSVQQRRRTSAKVGYVNLDQLRREGRWFMGEGAVDDASGYILRSAPSREFLAVFAFPPTGSKQPAYKHVALGPHVPGTKWGPDPGFVVELSREQAVAQYQAAIKQGFPAPEQRAMRLLRHLQRAQEEHRHARNLGYCDLNILRSAGLCTLGEGSVDKDSGYRFRSIGDKTEVILFAHPTRPGLHGYRVASGHVFLHEFPGSQAEKDYQETLGAWKRRQRVEPALMVLKSLRNAQETYKTRQGHYGDLDELKRAGESPVGEGEVKDGYRFTSEASTDTYTVTATPSTSGLPTMKLLATGEITQ